MAHVWHEGRKAESGRLPTGRFASVVVGSANVARWWEADIDPDRGASDCRDMDLDLPALTTFLSQPVTTVAVALPTSLHGRWPWSTNVRTNLAVVGTESGTLLFKYGASLDCLFNGISDENQWDGYSTKGTLTLIEKDADSKILEALALRTPFQSPEPFELIALDGLFPNAGRIFVPGLTACELTYTHTIRNGHFRFDATGLRIYSSEASTLIERGTGGVLECTVQS